MGSSGSGVCGGAGARRPHGRAQQRPGPQSPRQTASPAIPGPGDPHGDTDGPARAWASPGRRGSGASPRQCRRPPARGWSPVVPVTWSPESALWSCLRVVSVQAQKLHWGGSRGRWVLLRPPAPRSPAGGKDGLRRAHSPGPELAVPPGAGSPHAAESCLGDALWSLALATRRGHSVLHGLPPGPAAGPPRCGPQACLLCLASVRPGCPQGGLGLAPARPWVTRHGAPACPAGAPLRRPERSLYKPGGGGASQALRSAGLLAPCSARAPVDPP